MPVFEIELEDGTAYEIEADTQPTMDQVHSALGHVKSSGQGYSQALLSSAAQGAASIVPGVVGGIGALGSAAGMDDNSLVRAGDYLDEKIEGVFPVNPIYQGSFPVKAAGAIGQAAGQLASMGLTGGLGAGANAMRGVALGQAGLMGARGGLQTAEQYDITDPLKKAATILIGGIAEGGIEAIGGIGGKRFTDELLGSFPEQIAKYYGAKRAAKTILSEGGEEALTGAINDSTVMALAEEDPNRPGFTSTGAEIPSYTSPEFYKNRLEEAALGAVGGSVFAGYQAAFNRPDTAEAASWRNKATERIQELEGNLETLTPQQVTELNDLKAKDTQAKTYLQERGAGMMREGLLADPELAASNMSSYYENLANVAKTPEGKQQALERAEFWQLDDTKANLAAWADEYWQLNQQVSDLQETGTDPAVIQQVQSQIESHPLHRDNNLSANNQQQVMDSLNAFKATQQANAMASRNPAVVVANETANSIESVAPKTAEAVRSAAAVTTGINDVQVFNEIVNPTQETPLPQQSQSPQEGPLSTETVDQRPQWVIDAANEIVARVPSDIQDQVEELAAQRLTARQIASQLSMPVEDVLAIRQARGIPPLSEQIQGLSASPNNAFQENPAFTAWLASRSIIPQGQVGTSGASSVPAGVSNEQGLPSPQSQEGLSSLGTGGNQALANEGGQNLPAQRGLPVLPQAPPSQAQEANTPIRRLVRVGVTPSAAKQGINRLTGLIPDVDKTWTGTIDQLRNSKEFKESFISAAQARNPNAYREELESLHESFLYPDPENDSFGAEGFNMEGKNYLITDLIEVTELDQQRAKQHGGTTQEWAAARVLIHENWHTASREIKSKDSSLKKRYDALASQIPEAELDELASRRYQGYSNWRTNAESKDRLVDEWMAERMEGVGVETMPAPDTLVGKFLAWYRDVYARIVGLKPKDVKDEELIAMFDAWRNRKIQDDETQTPITESVARSPQNRPNSPEGGDGAKMVGARQENAAGGIDSKATSVVEEGPIGAQVPVETVEPIQGVEASASDKPSPTAFEAALREDVADETRFTIDGKNWKFSDSLGGEAFGVIRDGKVVIVQMDSIPLSERYSEKGKSMKRRGFLRGLLKSIQDNGFKDVDFTTMQSQDGRASLKRLVEDGTLVNPRLYAGISVDQFPTTFTIADKPSPGSAQSTVTPFETSLREQVSGVKAWTPGRIASVVEWYNNGANGQPPFGLLGPTGYIRKAMDAADPDKVKAARAAEAQEAKRLREAKAEDDEFSEKTTDTKAKAKIEKEMASQPEVQFSRVTPKQDADYLAAVERGDMESAQRMVDSSIPKNVFNREGVRVGFYVNGVPLEPSAAQRNFGPGYYAAEGADKNVGASEVSVTKTPNLRELSALGLNPEDVEFREERVVIQALNPLQYGGGSAGLTPSENALVDAIVDLEAATNDAYQRIDPKQLEALAKLRGVPRIDAAIGSRNSQEANRLIATAILIRDGRLPYDSIRGFGARKGMTSELVVFRPSQIKSSEPVTRDSDGNVIPLSQRFNPSSPDIRFSRKRSKESRAAEDQPVETSEDAREQNYEEVQKEDLPYGFKPFIQVLGKDIDKPSIIEKVKPLASFARNYMLDGIQMDADAVAYGDASRPAVSEANTKRIKALWARMQEGPEFAQEYLEQFRMQTDWDEKGSPFNKGGAAVGALQMEMLDYAKRLAASAKPDIAIKGSPRWKKEMAKLDLAMSMQFMANDIVIGDYMTVANAGRALQMRSMGGRMQGFWQMLKMINKAQVDAATKGGGAQKRYDDLLSAITDESVGSNIPQELADWLSSTPKGKKVLDALNGTEADVQRVEEKFISDALEESMQLLEQKRREVLTRLLSNLDKARAVKSRIDAQKAQSVVQQSSTSYGKTPNSIEELEAEMAALMESINRDLDYLSKGANAKIRKKTTSIKDAETEAKELVAKLNAEKVKVQKPKSPVKEAFTEQVKRPLSKETFRKKMSDLGVSEETADALYAQADKKGKTLRDAEKARKDAADTAEAIREAITLRREQNAARAAYLKREEAAQKKLDALDKKATQEAIREAKQLRKEQESRRIAFEKRESSDKAKLDKLLKQDEEGPTREAQAIIDKIDEQNTEWVPLDPKEKSEVQKIKAAGILDSRVAPSLIEGPRLNKSQFVAEYSKMLEDASVSPNISYAMAERLFFENMRLQTTRITRNRQSALDSTGFIRSLVEDILTHARSKQSNSDSRKEWMVNAFASRGMSADQAFYAAEALEFQLGKRFDDARVEAMHAAVKKLGETTKSKEPKKQGVTKNSVEALQRAIRSDLFDPSNPIALGLAAEAGFKPLSPEDFVRLAQLDELMSTAEATEASKYVTEMLNIVARTRMPKSAFNIIARSYVPTVLGGLSTQMMTWTAPAFSLIHRVGVDLVGLATEASIGKVSGKNAIAEISTIVDAFYQPYKAALSEAKFSMKNQAFSHRMQVHLAQVNSMNREYNDAKRQLQEALAAKSTYRTARASIKLAYTATDFIRVLMSGADQTWGGWLREYTLKTNAMRALLRQAGMTPTDAKMVLMTAEQDGIEEAQRRAEFLGSRDPSLQTLMARDYANNLLVREVNRLVQEKTGESGVGDQIIETAKLDTDMELGTRRGEDGALWDVPNILFEGLKDMSAAVKRRNELLGHFLTGFVTTPANLIDRSLYFTPVGLMRLYSKTKAINQGAGDNLYQETLKTVHQRRARAIEGLAGTAGILILTILQYALRDEDDEPILSVTGSGPTDRGQREAWMKEGNKPNALQVKLGGKIIQIPYGRGGFEGMNISLAAVGAVNDMTLNYPDADPLTMEYVGNYAQRAVTAVGKQASFIAPKSIFSAAMDTQASGKSVANQAAWSASSFIPFSSTVKSIGRLYSGPQDTTSIRSAVMTQIPVVGTITENKALNFLGDTIGGQGEDILTQGTNRSWYAGIPFGVASMHNGPRAPIYGFILDTGISPSAPNRRVLEQRNGFVPDDKWQDYVKKRGSLIVQKMRQRMPELRRVPRDEADNIVSRISADSTTEAKKALNLK
jgi:hypothetical protein